MPPEAFFATMNKAGPAGIRQFAEMAHGVKPKEDGTYPVGERPEGLTLVDMEAFRPRTISDLAVAVQVVYGIG